MAIRTKNPYSAPLPSSTDDKGRKMADKIRMTAIEEHAQQLEDPEKRGAWLNSNATFDHGLKLPDDKTGRLAMELLERLLSKFRRRVRDLDKKQLDMEILCANLLTNKRNRPIAISLNKNDYIPNRYTRAGYFTAELVRLLKQDKWIEQALGIWGVKEARMSRIWPTQDFLDYFNPFDQLDFVPVELVNLKDKDGRLKGYDDTQETNKIRKTLTNANLLNREALVQLKTRQGFRSLNTDLYTVFNNSFDEGGRLYTGRDGYQSLNKEERGRIWINRSPTVELDFSGMQPRLLYALEGIQYDEDPYTAIIGDYPDLRPFAKQLLLALINASSLSKAVASGNNSLHLDHDLYLTMKEIGTRTAELIERFKQVHSDIAHHFGKKTGLKLMRLDARIALDVVESLTGRGIPVLAIHDSFIVQKDQKDLLRKTMQEAYRKNTGGFECPIKEEKHA